MHAIVDIKDKAAAADAPATINILIAEVEPDWQTRLRDLVASKFPPAGSGETFRRKVDVKVAGNFTEAIKIIEKQTLSFSVAVIDTCLSPLDSDNEQGLSLAEYLRRFSPRTEVIFIAKEFLLEQYKRGQEIKPGAEFFEKEPKDKDEPQDKTSFQVDKFVSALETAVQDANLCDVFVIMPYARQYRHCYDHVIKPSVEQLYPVCRRADEFFSSQIIMPNILEFIQHSQFTIADLSGGNANVIFEAGIAHASGKNVILLTRQAQDVPELLNQFSFFEFKEQEPESLKQYLIKAIHRLQRERFNAPFSKDTLSTVDGLCVVLTPEYDSKQNPYTGLIEPVLASQGLKGEVHLQVVGNKKLQEMWKQICQANVVIADLTTYDPSVIYLAGLAYGLEKYIIFVVSPGQKTPIDLRGCVLIDYPRANSASKFTQILQTLKSKNILKPPAPHPAAVHLPVKRQAPHTDILLVTATEIETQAVEDLRLPYRWDPLPLKKNAYFDLGDICGARVILLQTDPGSITANGALANILDGIDELGPRFVIMLGIAFGARPQSQKIGDLLIANQIVQYDLQRFGTGKSGQPVQIVRGDRASATPFLLNRFRVLGRDWKGAKKIPGLILSGNILVDNLEERQNLCAFEPEAIGGEMEGTGLYAAAHRQSKPWYLVKGICDWGDGKKHVNKQKRQEKAARNAASFVFHVLGKGGFEPEE